MIPGGVSDFIFQGPFCFHFFFRTTDDQIGCFGENFHGQLGTGNNSINKTPLLRREISGIPSSSEILSISANFWATFILTKKGEVYSSGAKGSNGYPYSTNKFQKLPFETPIIRVSSGCSHAFFLSSGGDVFYCSRSDNDKLPETIKKKPPLPGTTLSRLDDLRFPELPMKEL